MFVLYFLKGGIINSKIIFQKSLLYSKESSLIKSRNVSDSYYTNKYKLKKENTFYKNIINLNTHSYIH